MGLSIIDKYTTKGVTRVHYKCDVCGFIGSMREAHYRNNVGCSVCSGKTVLAGYNDVATTRPDLVRFFKNKEDATKYSSGSNKQVIVECETCGFTKSIAVSQLCRYGFSCPTCHGNISFPNRYMYSFLNENNIPFETEKMFKWSGRYRYDFYVEQYNLIIEMHGAQHYGLGGWGNFSVIYCRDNEKEALATNNGIENYYIIPAVESTPVELSTMIKCSGLCELFGLDIAKIDWQSVYDMAEADIGKQCLSLWSQGMSAPSIAKELKICSTTVVKYLKRYASLGLCDYDPTYEQSKNHVLAVESHRKQVICLNTGQIYSSIRDAAAAYNISERALQSNLAGRTKTSGRDCQNNKLRWKYYTQ